MSPVSQLIRNVGKSGILCLLFVCQILMQSSVFSQENSNAIFQVKSFLERPPALQTLTFLQLSKGMGDKVGYSEDGKLYTASLQDDSFVIAELKTNEVPEMSAKTLPIGGKIGSFRWSIIGMTLNLGQTNSSQIDPTDPAVTISEQYEPILDEPMNLGIYHAERGTLHVSENGEFSGPIAKRLLSWGADSKIEGQFNFSPDGLMLQSATWQVTSKPEVVFHTQYFYDEGQTNFLPSSWIEWAIRNGKNLNTNQIKILKYEVASSKLSQDFFLPDRFIVKSNLPSIGPIILTRQNGKTLWLQNGKFQAVNIPIQDLPQSLTKHSVWIVRIFIFGFTVVGLLILIRSAFVGAKQRKQK